MPRPIKWDGKIEGQLIRASARFSGLELRLYSPNAQVEANSSGIEDSKTVVPDEILEMARASFHLGYLT
jgi:hypothetical protein